MNYSDEDVDRLVDVALSEKLAVARVHSVRGWREKYRALVLQNEADRPGYVRASVGFLDASESLRVGITRGGGARLTSMTRDEYTRLMMLAAGLWSHEPTQRTIDAWWQDLERFTLADAEDAVRRLARKHDRWPALSLVLGETRLVREGRPRTPPVVHVWSESERERLMRFGKLIEDASRAGRLDVVRKAMNDADRFHSDPLEAGEAVLQHAMSSAA